MTKGANQSRARSMANEMIINLVKTEPNNTRLGEKVRKLINYMYG